MNCANCGASLPGNSNVCTFCNTRNEVDLRGIHRYTTERPESERICPCCAVALATMNLRSDGSFLIEQCPQCFGLFFDPGEVEALLEDSVEHVYEIKPEMLATLTRETYRPDPVIYRKCPICRGFMDRQNFGQRSGVVVDRCRPHGVWLDSGEFRRLAEWMKAGGQILQEQTAAEHEAAAREAALKASTNAGFKALTGDVPGIDPRPLGRAGLLGLIAGAIGTFVAQAETGDDSSS